MNKKGFTLVELLIVVAIIGIVAAIAIPNLLTALQKGKQKTTMGDMHTLGNAVDSYITDWSMSPVDTGTMRVSIDQTWFRPFYIKTLPNRDGWGNDFDYDAVGGAASDDYSIISYGRDGTGDGLAASGVYYDVTSMADFSRDIYFSNGQFMYGPEMKRK